MRKSKELQPPIPRELIEQAIVNLKEALEKFKKTENYELCQWIKERIDYRQKQLNEQSHSHTLRK